MTVNLMLWLLPATVHCVMLDYGIYSPGEEVPCTTLEPTVIPNPIPIDSLADCNVWRHTDYDNFTTWNSMYVSSCSQNCICYHQWADSDNCGEPYRGNAYKIACVDQCIEDDQFTYLKLAEGFIGCGDDEDFGPWECEPTGLRPNQTITIIDTDGSIISLVTSAHDEADNENPDYATDSALNSSRVGNSTVASVALDIDSSFAFWYLLRLLICVSVLLALYAVYRLVRKTHTWRRVRTLLRHSQPGDFTRDTRKSERTPSYPQEVHPLVPTV